MGFCAEKVNLDGLFGGVTVAKSNGKTYVSVMSPGPKIDKVEVVNPVTVPNGLAFGAPVRLALTNAEQKFKDFNGSFCVAETLVFQLPSK